MNRRVTDFDATAGNLGQLVRLRPGYLVFGGFLALFAIAFIRVHVRMETTLTGYEIGRLKAEESSLLEKRSLLKMSLARLTTRQHLSMVTSDRPDNPETPVVSK